MSVAKIPGKWRCLLPALISLLLSSCGFHLQGRNDLPRSLANVQVDAEDTQSEFFSALRASLLSAGSQFNGAAQDTATIRVLDDSASERVLTVSARNIPTAYQLSYRVKVSVTFQGRELLPPEEHTVSREYSFDEHALLAKLRERDALVQALADDLAALVLRRLAAL